jgi:hypothetical protein
MNVRRSLTMRGPRFLFKVEKGEGVGMRQCVVERSDR